MKFVPANSIPLRRERRTPHGVRGLKLRRLVEIRKVRLSHPTRGAWIEIFVPSSRYLDKKSHPTRGAWIEITCGC